MCTSAREGDSCDRERARLAFGLLPAAIIAVAIKIVGGLLFVALLVMPPATVRHLSRSPEAMAVRAPPPARSSLSGCSTAANGWRNPVPRNCGRERPDEPLVPSQFSPRAPKQVSPLAGEISPTCHPNVSQSSRSMSPNVATQCHHGSHPERSDAIKGRLRIRGLWPLQRRTMHGLGAARSPWSEMN